MTASNEKHPTALGLDMAEETDRYAMTLVVTAPQPLSVHQRETILASIKPNLPHDVGLVLLDGGFSSMVVSSMSTPGVDALNTEGVDSAMLEEIKALRADMAVQRDQPLHFVQVGMKRPEVRNVSRETGSQLRDELGMPITA